MFFFHVKFMDEYVGREVIDIHSQKCVKDSYHISEVVIV